VRVLAYGSVIQDFSFGKVNLYSFMDVVMTIAMVILDSCW